MRVCACGATVASRRGLVKITSSYNDVKKSVQRFLQLYGYIGNVWEVWHRLLAAPHIELLWGGEANNIAYVLTVFDFLELSDSLILYFPASLLTVARSRWHDRAPSRPWGLRLDHQAHHHRSSAGSQGASLRVRVRQRWCVGRCIKLVIPE